jgi:hypothetical protein
MKNERTQIADYFSAKVPTGTKAGDPVLALAASTPAVAATDEGKGGNIAGRASVQSVGIYDLWTTDAVAAEGTAIYITGDGTAAGTLTTTASGNTLFGRTIAAPDGSGATKASGGTKADGPFVHVRLVKA